MPELGPGAYARRACVLTILSCYLAVDLLTNCSQVVDKVLDSRDEMLRTWADLPLVTAVCEAMKQMHMR